MALRYSDNDKRAMQAAAAIRAQNKAVDDYNSQMPQAYERLAQAQSKPTNALESILSGIGNSIKNVGDTLYDMGGTGIASIRDLVTGNAGNSKYQDEWKQYRKAQRGDANMSDKDYYAKTAGTALDAAATVSDLIPGLGVPAKVALNIGQGAASGAAQNFIDNGANVSLEDILKGATTGAASAGVGQIVGGKLANGVNLGNGRIGQALGKVANSNIGRAALTGAASGATGGGLNAAFNGGDVIGGALQGAQGGALAGGTMAGAMGLVGAGLDKLNNKYGGAAQDATTTRVSTLEDALQGPQKSITEEVAEQYAKPAKRTIDVQYEGDSEPVDVTRKRSNQYRLADRSGSTLDGILGPNNKTQLSNAMPDTRAQFRRLFGDDSTSDISAAVKNGVLDAMGDDAISKDAALKGILDSDTYNQLRAATKDYADYNNSALDGYGVTSKSELPKIRTSDYIEATGYKGKDIPDYMRPFLSEENGTSLKDSSWSQIMPEYNDGGQFTGTPDDILQMYDDLAGTNRNLTYTNENLIGALETNPDLFVKATEQVLADGYPTRSIEVDKRLPMGQQIDVNAPNQRRLIQDVTPGKRQAQPAVEVQTEAPRQTARQMAAPQETRANPNLSQAEVARLERDITVNRQKQGAALLEQYGSLDAPLRRGLGSPEDVLVKLYDDYGLTTPQDVQYAATHVTGRDGLVSKLTRELAAGAENVDTRITRDWLQDIMDLNGLTDEDAKTVTKQVIAALKRSGATGITDGNTALDAIKQLEKQSAQYKGKDGVTYRRGSAEGTQKAMVLDAVRDELQGRVWDAAGDPSRVLTPDRLTELKNMYPGNEKWANFVDNGLASVKTGAQMRSTMKPLVDGAKIVAGSKQSAGSVAEKAYKAATSANPVVAGGQVLLEIGLGTDKAKQNKADRYAKRAAKSQAKLTGDAPSGGIAQGVIDKAGKMLDNTMNNLNNETFSGKAISPITRNGVTQTIGDVANRSLWRNAGLGAANAANNQAQLQDAQQQVMGIQNNYNNAMNEAQQMYNQAQQMGGGTGTGTLDRISQGMERALAAGDINAYSQLADLYQQAYKIYGLQNPEAASTSSAKDLTANQAKAYAGLQQLTDLAQMTPDLGAALASTPAGGIVDLLGGNEYSNQAKALATTIGYLMSGANIREQEAQRIGQAYVPSAFDSEQVKQQKLSRAEQLLRSYLSNSSTLE